MQVQAQIHKDKSENKTYTYTGTHLYILYTIYICTNQAFCVLERPNFLHVKNLQNIKNIEHSCLLAEQVPMMYKEEL